MKKNTDIKLQESKPVNNKDLLAQDPQFDQSNPQNPAEKSVEKIDEVKQLAATMPAFSKNNTGGFKKSKKFYSSSFSKTTYKLIQKSRSRSRSPVNYNVEPTLRRTNGIPIKLTDRLNYLGEIFKNEKFIKYYNQAPPRNTSSLDQITKYLTKYTGPKGEIETYAMIFYYICNQITYDRKGVENHRDNSYDQKPDNVIKSGLALGEGFNKLFEYMCNKKHLKIKVLQGNCKLLPLKEKGNKTNHVWSAIYFKGEWYFCDLLMGSGGIVEKNTMEEVYFNPYYFITPPEYLIVTHRVDDDDWQMNTKTMTEKQYYSKRCFDIGAFYQKVYEHNVKLLSHDYPVITVSNNELIIKINILHAVIQSDLYYSNGKDKIAEVKYSVDEDSNIFSLEPTFPGNGEYIIRILSRPTTSTDLIYNKLLDYRVRVCDESHFRFNRFKITKPKEKQRNSIANISMPQIKYEFNQTKIIPDYNKIFPSKTNKRICFDNEGAHIFEPKNIMLKKGNEVKFKVRVKGALVVAVLDGKKWTYLKRKDEAIYEGQTIIQSDNVSICSLKACNVFTEVFRFKSYKDKNSIS